VCLESAAAAGLGVDALRKTMDRRELRIAEEDRFAPCSEARMTDLIGPSVEIAVVISAESSNRAIVARQRVFHYLKCSLSGGCGQERDAAARRIEWIMIACLVF
jgi:hypothetical protein